VIGRTTIDLFESHAGRHQHPGQFHSRKRAGFQPESAVQQPGARVHGHQSKTRGVDNGGGASQVSIITPKGTEQLARPRLLELPHKCLGGHDWFNDARGAPTPNLLRNQGGGNMAGPILKDKLFIYGWYELLRLRQQAVNNTTVISPAIPQRADERESDLAIHVYPSSTRTATRTRRGPQAINLLNFTNNQREQFQLRGRSQYACG